MAEHREVILLHIQVSLVKYVLYLPELPKHKFEVISQEDLVSMLSGGRCETCMGGGMKVIEMNFLPDVLVNVRSCQGKRFNRETLEIRFKGKSISDILNMTIDLACLFFEPIPKI